MSDLAPPGPKEDWGIVIDNIADHEARKRAKDQTPMFTKEEREEMDQYDALRATGYSFPFSSKPLHSNPLVCEIAELLMKVFS
jgi:hypothetical protein